MSFPLSLHSSQWLWLSIIAYLLALICAAIPLLPLGRKRRPGRLSHSTFPASAYSKSVIGSRDYQQDYVRLPRNVQPELLASRGLLCVLCDGMGGMDSGEVASRMCADVLMDAYYSEEAVAPDRFFRTKAAQADRQIAALRSKDGHPLRTGTTMVSVLLQGNTVYYASAGDSRIYLYRQKKLRQLTRDHNYLLQLMQQVDSGALTLDAALSNPKREALISYVGKGSIDLLDVESLPAMPGDILLLCSDGLTKALTDEEILCTLNEGSAKPYLLPDALIAQALRKRWICHDNITVAVVCNSPRTMME
ncbi:MAG: protein phosphatase 2C domain-containing protein [Clostridia bacterium]|nr:protein phosphatase 2C domain-containing protein [Clostridia bacterium]